MPWADTTWPCKDPEHTRPKLVPEVDVVEMRMWACPNCHLRWRFYVHPDGTMKGSW